MDIGEYIGIVQAKESPWFDHVREEPSEDITGEDNSLKNSESISSLKSSLHILVPGKTAGMGQHHMERILGVSRLGWD